MAAEKSLPQWLDQLGVTLEDLVERSGIEARLLEAIVAGRYTPSPQQRGRVAAALGVSADEIVWGNFMQVDHMYGHGPQFGRSP